MDRPCRNPLAGDSGSYQIPAVIACATHRVQRLTGRSSGHDPPRRMEAVEHGSGSHSLGSEALTRPPLAGTRDLPSASKITAFGNALRSFSTPASVTFVPMSDSRRRPVSPARCGSPASVTTVPSRSSSRRLVSPFKWARPASVTDVSPSRRIRRLVSPLRWASPASATDVSSRMSSCRPVKPLRCLSPPLPIEV